MVEVYLFGKTTTQLLGFTPKELDQSTQIPHLLIEIRSLGFVELQGKDTGGIYGRLDHWLKEHWKVLDKTLDFVEVRKPPGCCSDWSIELAIGELQEHHKLCDKSYTMGPLNQKGIPLNPHGIYKSRGVDGENNMGKLTMQLAEFMTQECGWTLQVCDSGNLGFRGNIREQQLKFKAPHPLNMISPLILIELRATRPVLLGYIEVSGQNKDDIFEKLGGFFKSMWKAEGVENDPDYCDLKFSTRAFRTRGLQGENNIGLRTMELVDFMVKQCHWTMVTCNMGNFRTREQQLVFRKDDFIEKGAEHIMVELRTAGYVEVNGLHDAEDLKPHLIEFLTTQWGCTEYTKYFLESSEKFCDLKYTAPKSLFYLEGLTNNLGQLTLSLAEFLANHGWQLALCNGGNLYPYPEDSPNFILREQQVKFTRTTPEKAWREGGDPRVTGCSLL